MTRPDKEDEENQIRNRLQRSATLPAKTFELRIRSKNTENRDSTIKMASEDLLQPGHIVKERWKVFKPNNNQYFFKYKIVFFRF